MVVDYALAARHRLEQRRLNLDDLNIKDYCSCYGSLAFNGFYRRNDAHRYYYSCRGRTFSQKVPWTCSTKHAAAAVVPYGTHVFRARSRGFGNAHPIRS